MTTPQFETELHLRVYNNQHGYHIDVGYDEDGLELVKVVHSEEKTTMIFFPDEAEHVANAILRVVADMRQRGINS